MTRRYRLTRRASADLSGIHQYSANIWGTAQAKLYLEQIHEAACQLADNPELGVSRPDLGEGVRAWRVQSHWLFYRSLGGTPRILRVLHVRQYADPSVIGD